MPMLMVLVATGDQLRDSKLVEASTTTLALVAQESLKAKALV